MEDIMSNKLFGNFQVRYFLLAILLPLALLAEPARRRRL